MPRKRYWTPAGSKDWITRGNISIDTNHAQVHESYAFSFYSKEIIPASGTVYIGLTTAPGSYLHVQAFFLDSRAAACTVYLQEEAVFTGGTSVKATNHNRVSKTPAYTQVVYQPTVTDEGTPFMCMRADGTTGPGNVQTGAQGRLADEYIFAPDTKYVFKLVNENGTEADVVFNMFWYEEGLG